MLGFMLETLAQELGAPWEVRTAGTFTVENQAIGPRTLAALEGIEELNGHHFVAHRSHQLSADDVAWADVILAAEADHVVFVRARHPEAAPRVVQIAVFCRFAPLDAPFAEQLRAAVATTPDDHFDVIDPAGGEQAQYDECAEILWGQAQVFATLVTADSWEV
jgi:protein-tyrosine-phosphatase